jgi:hypothetical protein
MEEGIRLLRCEPEESDIQVQYRKNDPSNQAFYKS